MKGSLFGKLLLVALASASASCKPRPDPPAPPRPPAPASAIAAPAPRPPAAAKNRRKSFEGTWLTDQGALILVRETVRDEENISGLFLPFHLPCALFRANDDEFALEFRSLGDGNLRWQGTLNLEDQGYAVRGWVRQTGSNEGLPCEGRRIGPSTDNGVPALVRALEHDDPWVRRSAADALGALRLSARGSVPALVRGLQDEDLEVPRRIAVALARIGAAPASSVPILTCHLRDASPRIRAGAADALGVIGEGAADALPDLLARLEDQDSAVRAGALGAVVRLGRSSPAALARSLRSEDQSVVLTVLEALSRNGPPARECLGLLADKLDREEDRTVARKALADLAAVPAPAPERPESDWPQWRGPRKDNVSAETGLLREWPKEGPPLVWEIWGIGEGIAAVSVRDGRVFALGYLNGWEYLTALDARTGRCLWTAALGPGHLENSHMRWVAQRTPTAGRSRVYAMLASGQLVALRADDGKEEWRADYLKLFGDRPQDYGYVDHPLEEDDRLVCTPASERATLAALDPATGRVLWKTRAPEVPLASSPSTVAMTLAGRRQYVVCAGVLCGFDQTDGTHLWTYEGRQYSNDRWIVRTPMAVGDSGILVRGPDLNRLTRLNFSAEGGPHVDPVYWRKQQFGWLQDTSVVQGPWLYAHAEPTLEAVGVDAVPEVRVHLDHGTGSYGSMTFADGRLYVLGCNGRLALVEASGKNMKVISTATIPMFVRTSGTSNPVIAQGRLYVRDSDRLLCYDLHPRDSGSAPEASRVALEPPAPPPSAEPAKAAFVPTPHDVVDRMLDLARLREADVLFDLGSGDGRILLAARRDRKAKAVGYEINHDLVVASRQEVEKRGYADAIRIEEADLFTADLSTATVIALYLPEEILTRLKPKFDGLKPGVRIVSHQFRIPGTVPDREETFDSREDGGRHTVYVWTTPLRRSE